MAVDPAHAGGPKPSLERAVAAAQVAPPTWDAVQTDEVWSSIEGRRRKRAHRRRVGGMLIVVVVGLGIAGLADLRSPAPETSKPASAVATGSPVAAARSGPDAPSADTSRPSAEGHADDQRDRELEGSAEPHSPEPDAPVVLAARDTTVHAGEHASYRATEDWSGQLTVADGSIGITGSGAAFSVHTQSSATVVSVQAAVIVVEYAAERRVLRPGDVLRIESEQVVANARAPKTSRARPTAEELLGRADDARRQGDLAEAAKMLRQFTRRHAAHQDAATAWFQLGKVERRRGRHRAAASSFAASRRLLRGSVLESDALAEHARSLAAAGRDDDARARAREYLRWKPQGLHAADMRAIVDAG